MRTIEQVPYKLGERQESGALAVYPVLGGEPRLGYVGLSRAIGMGASVREVDPQGSVGDVLVANPCDLPLLVYEGELIMGARQNRTFDASVLVPAGAELSVAVTCVEAGRWEGGRAREEFSVAPHAADPALRASKRVHSNRAGSHGAEVRADQGEVWEEVSARLRAHSVSSPSSSLRDLYAARRTPIERLREPVVHVDGQIGAVVAISGRPVALDLVSRPEVFAELLPRLADGYALQALGAKPGTPSEAAAHGFLEAAVEGRRGPLPAAGIGEAFSVTQKGIEGAGLTVLGELVALSAFPGAASLPSGS